MAAVSVLDAPKLSLAEAARRLGVHVNTLHRWRLHGVGGVRLPITRIGGKSVVLLSDLERFIALRSDPPSAAEQAESFADRAADASAKCRAIGL